jgi:hypothetical protein
MSTPEMVSGAWRDISYGKKYPGAGWMKYLAADAMDGHSALEHLQSGAIKPENIFIVSEERQTHALFLEQMGAKKTVQLCLESPMFAPRFYDGLKNSARTLYENSMLFSGGTEHVYFPSFDDLGLEKAPIPWAERHQKPLVAVCANKHYSSFQHGFANSPTFAKALKHQLHDKRREAFNYFLYRDMLDLYGRGWGMGIEAAHDKLETIRDYRFALCFENCRWPGYITEKIIDCFVAGTIPIYLGAPDIAEYIPEEFFIRGELGFEAIEEKISNLSPKRAEEMILEAWIWLKYGAGRQYDNYSFAERIKELCR